jgi:hypothetical protein
MMFRSCLMNLFAWSVSRETFRLRSHHDQNPLTYETSSRPTVGRQLLKQEMHGIRLYVGYLRDGLVRPTVDDNVQEPQPLRQIICAQIIRDENTLDREVNPRRPISYVDGLERECCYMLSLTLTINRMFLTPAVIFCQKSSGTALGTYIMARNETPLPVSPWETKRIVSRHSEVDLSL